MLRKELIRLLEAAGYGWAREGDHTTMYKPGVPKDQPPLRGLIQIPRHREINEITAREILKQAGIAEKRKNSRK